MLMVNPLNGFGGYASAAVAGHRYWKFSFTGWAGAGTQGEIAEFELRVGTTDQLPDMTSNTTSGVTVSTNDDIGGLAPAFQAADDDAATNWGTADRTGTKTWTVDFGAGNEKDLDDYKITSRSNGFNYPTAWTLAWSDDGSSYTTADTQTSQSFGSGETKTYTIP